MSKGLNELVDCFIQMEVHLAHMKVEIRTIETRLRCIEYAILKGEDFVDILGQETSKKVKGD